MRTLATGVAIVALVTACTSSNISEDAEPPDGQGTSIVPPSESETAWDFRVLEGMGTRWGEAITSASGASWSQEENDFYSMPVRSQDLEAQFIDSNAELSAACRAASGDLLDELGVTEGVQWASAYAVSDDRPGDIAQLDVFEVAVSPQDSWSDQLANALGACAEEKDGSLVYTDAFIGPWEPWGQVTVSRVPGGSAVQYQATNSDYADKGLAADYLESHAFVVSGNTVLIASSEDGNVSAEALLAAVEQLATGSAPG